MSKFKYQEDFAAQLAEHWMTGNHEFVRTTIRTLKNKAQAAFIAATVAAHIFAQSPAVAGQFCAFIHPNNP